MHGLTAIVLSVTTAQSSDARVFLAASPAQPAEKGSRLQADRPASIGDEIRVAAAAIDEVAEAQPQQSAVDHGGSEPEVNRLPRPDRTKRDSVVVNLEADAVRDGRTEVDKPSFETGAGRIAREPPDGQDRTLLRYGQPERGPGTPVSDHMSGIRDKAGERDSEKSAERGLVQPRTERRQTVQKLLHLFIALIGGALIGSGCGRSHLPVFRSDRVIGCVTALIGLAAVAVGIGFLAHFSGG
ncbi:hypothetical protein ACFSC3_08010 [Sphingomonas floccifaciens]|uniref:Uncharacterized protein n=1 Tax=Sphingomonas floccifaciens TaxID=1844115 RepID=A0ABW4NC39_9SPHN